MQAFVDLEGKIPAKDGDRVALVKCDYTDIVLTSSCVSHRPIYRDGWLCPNPPSKQYEEDDPLCPKDRRISNSKYKFVRFIKSLRPFGN